MRENDFEKRVQQKMGELDLRPSPEVWLEVERRIREEKKRRFIFWWPLFLLLGGGIAAGIYFMQKKYKKEEIVQQEKKEQSNEPAANKIETVTPEEHIKTTERKELREIKETNDSNAKTIVIVKEKTQPAKPTIIKTKNGTQPLKPALIKKEKQRIIPPVGKKNKEQEIAVTEKKKENKKENDTVKDNRDKVNNEKEPSVVVDTPALSQPVAESKPNTPLPDTATKINASITSSPGVEERNDSTTTAQPTKPDNKKKGKWDWGVTGAVGRSSIVNGLHLFHGANAYSDVLSAGPSASPSFRSAPLIDPSFSGSVGVFIKRDLSKMIQLRIGLDYEYLSTKMDAGIRKDSSFVINGTTFNGFYRPVSTASVSASAYTNQFHFISLSAELSWKVIKGKHFQLSWTNGLSFRQLVSSNMLHYYSPLDFYYKNNNLLKKGYLFFTTGFSFPVSKRFELNPFASYSLTSLSKSNTAAPTDFFQYGIRFRLLLKKNK